MEHPHICDSPGKAEAVRELIRGTRGRLFHITFIKKDGTVRNMLARSGVKLHVSGKGMAFDPARRHLMPIWDMQKHEWRMINLDTVTYFKCGKAEVTYEVA